MNALRFVWFDVKNGIAREWKAYLVAVLVFGLLSFSLLIACRSLAVSLGMDAETLTLGDCLVNTAAGMKEYVFDPSNPFDFPAAWLLVFLMAAYLTLNYPYRDLMGVGKHLIIVSGSRTLWWVSKCLWVVLSVGLFWTVAFAAAVLWTVLSGGPLTLDVSALVPVVLKFEAYSLLPQPWNIAGMLAVVPAMTAAVCLAQLLLSLFIKPMFSYIAIIALLFFSAYFQTPWLVGNYLMAARSQAFVAGGMDWHAGLMIACAIIAVVVVGGGLLFRRMDILEWEQ